MTIAGVIGGGAWGTALAATAARAELEVKLWAFEKEVVGLDLGSPLLLSISIFSM